MENRVVANFVKKVNGVLRPFGPEFGNRVGGGNACHPPPQEIERQKFLWRTAEFPLSVTVVAFDLRLPFDVD